MTFTLKQIIEERVPAWEKCETCRYFTGLYDRKTGKWARGCSNCNGEGGRWHGTVKEGGVGIGNYIGGEYHGLEWINAVDVTKSSHLIREHQVCKLCIGEGCSECNGTGAEPNTEGPWRVE